MLEGIKYKLLLKSEKKAKPQIVKLLDNNGVTCTLYNVTKKQISFHYLRDVNSDFTINEVS